MANLHIRPPICRVRVFDCGESNELIGSRDYAVFHGSSNCRGGVWEIFKRSRDSALPRFSRPQGRFQPTANGHKTASASGRTAKICRGSARERFSPGVHPIAERAADHSARKCGAWSAGFPTAPENSPTMPRHGRCSSARRGPQNARPDRSCWPIERGECSTIASAARTSWPR